MYPPFEHDVINQRRDELWRLADQARLAKQAARPRPRRGPAVRGAIGSMLIRAGQAVRGGEALQPATRDC